MHGLYGERGFIFFWGGWRSRNRRLLINQTPKDQVSIVNVSSSLEDCPFRLSGQGVEKVVKVLKRVHPKTWYRAGRNKHGIRDL